VRPFASLILPIAMALALPAASQAAEAQGLALPGDALVAVALSRLLRVEPTLPRVSDAIDDVAVWDVTFDPDGNLILVANSGISRVDFHSGERTPIRTAPLFGNVQNVVVDERGDIFVVVSGNSNQLIRIDPETGAATVLFPSLDRDILPGRPQPGGLAIDPKGGFLVTLRGSSEDIDAVVHLDPDSGAAEVVSSGGLLQDPWGIVIDETGRLLIADQRARAIIGIDATTGEQSLVAVGDKLSSPYDLDLSDDGRIYVSELSGGAILEINPETGLQRLLGVASATRGIVVVPGEPAPPACRDGLDNDRDRRRDFPKDPGCAGPDDGTEEPPCADGLDNDDDGLVDFGEDPGCSNARPRAQEAPQCDDGRDNDGDGLFDYPEDPQCVARSDNSEHWLPRRLRLRKFSR